jgi:tRNA threonylcarbamoyladenosine biosynthesis protein TsaB
VAGAVLTLAVTTSTSVVGVAVGPAGSSGGSVTANQVLTDRRHAEELTPLLALTLSQAGVGIDAVEVFVVDVGPGRFTGLRVGLATVRALALATGRPVIGLTSLEILAGAEPDRPLVAVVDARRGEVFQQLFGGPCGPSGPAVVGLPAELAPPAVGMVVVGDGGDRYQELYGPGLRAGRSPSAAVMVAMSAGRAAVAGPEVEPVYLRDPDVNINVKTRLGPR